MKKQLASGVSNQFIDEAYEQARKNGALGGKITGAGGGGHLLAFVPFDRRMEVLQVVQSAGGRNVPYRIHRVGLTTWEEA